MTAVRLRALDFVLFPHGTKPGLSFAAWWQKTMFAQDINRGALNTSLRTNIFHVPPKQIFRDYLPNTARLNFVACRKQPPLPEKQEHQVGIADSFEADSLKARLDRRIENPVPHPAYAYEGDGVSWRFLHQHWIKHAMTKVAGDFLLGAGVWSVP